MEERVIVREGNGNCPKMPHVPGVYEEGTCTGIQSRKSLCVDNVLQGKFSDIIPMLVVSVLSQKTDSTLGVILIELWHVQIINKVNKFLLPGWTKLFSSNFLQELFQLDLQIARVSIIREVD